LAVILLVMALSVCAQAQDCAIELKDEVRGIHVAVEYCANIGTYSIGGLYYDGFEKLTFRYPTPWKGTFTSFIVDQELYCTSDNPRNCTRMDAYVTRKPRVRGNSVESAWGLPDIGVVQELSIWENHTTIRYTVLNTGSANHSVGVRLHLDTMLGTNDGAPIYVPGDGLKTRETDYSGGRLDFEYWKAYNHPAEPTIVATARIDPKAGYTYPARVVIADWKKSKDTAWDYEPTARSVAGDSAVLIYYDLGVIQAGEIKEVSVGYGSEAPVLRREQGMVGVTEITLGKVSGLYCPGDEVKFKVDVLSAGQRREGRVGVLVIDGAAVYYNNTVGAVFEEDQVKTLAFNWVVPELNDSKTFTVKAVLYNETDVVDVRERRDAVRVDLDRCVSPVMQVTDDVFRGMLLVLAAVAAGMVGILLFYIWYNMGTVEFAKHVDGENVTVRVGNTTRRPIRGVVIEDTIPGETEIRVRTLGVLRRQNTLTWEVGDLQPNGEATLEYWIKDGRAVSESNLRWGKGGKRLK
jgi:hypothetical protein